MPIDATLTLAYTPVIGGQILRVTPTTNADKLHFRSEANNTDTDIPTAKEFMSGTSPKGDTWTFTATRNDGGKPAEQKIVIPPASAPNVQPNNQPTADRIKNVVVVTTYDSGKVTNTTIS